MMKETPEEHLVVHHTLAPCPLDQLLDVRTVDRQQYLGTWYFKAAVSHREEHIHKFRAFDSMSFTLVETSNDTLQLTGNTRMGDDCKNQTWTYRVNPEKDYLEMEGRPQRISLLWSGRWADCLDCILFQEIEPPLHHTDSEDSLSRLMLYARQRNVSSEVVTTFLNSAACHKLSTSVTPPEQKEFCF